MNQEFIIGQNLFQTSEGWVCTDTAPLKFRSYVWDKNNHKVVQAFSNELGMDSYEHNKFHLNICASSYPIKGVVLFDLTRFEGRLEGLLLKSVSVEVVGIRAS